MPCFHGFHCAGTLGKGYVQGACAIIPHGKFFLSLSGLKTGGAAVLVAHSRSTTYIENKFTLHHPPAALQIKPLALKIQMFIARAAASWRASPAGPIPQGKFVLSLSG
ncbi:MAG: hypothetical protein QM278_11810 [Pseudomonadota bacterium]|nr:hypothetical protein [Pseudomonadota bacterium]